MSQAQAKALDCADLLRQFAARVAQDRYNVTELRMLNKRAKAILVAVRAPWSEIQKRM